MNGNNLIVALMIL